MKLFSRFADRDKLEEERARKLIRIKETEELAKEVNIRLARSEAEFNEMLARNRSKWALEEEEHQKRIKDMSEEIKSLEKRKQQALIPISMYKQEADKLLEEAKEIVQKTKEKEEQAEYLQEKLEDKLTELEDRENQIQKKEKEQEIAQKGIEYQQEQVKQGIGRLSAEMLAFYEKQERDEKSIAERKKEVSLAEINLQAKMEKYKQNLEALKVWEKQLIDQRETLEREKLRRSS